MSVDVPQNLVNNTEKAEKRLRELLSKLEEIRKVKIEEKIISLTGENKILAAKVQKAKSELIKLETLNGKKQYGIPGKSANLVDSNPAIEKRESAVDSNVPKVSNETSQKKGKKEIVNKKEKTVKPIASNANDIVDVRKLDLRIGKIIEVNKHPDAESLYVEKIDCGEDQPRTVVSGLVNHVPIDEMRDRIVMVLCNLKPAKMRGVTSEAMVMCASSPDKVEVLIPPNGAVPGDLVLCEGYPREPEPQLNPKKKIFETCAPDLKTNSDKIACYKNSPLIIPGKGPIIAASLKEVSVK